ncbi:hypothetical protein FA95DRAFT_1612504, partial [Auriscalpium vulgare]
MADPPAPIREFQGLASCEHKDCYDGNSSTCPGFLEDHEGDIAALAHNARLKIPCLYCKHHAIWHTPGLWQGSRNGPAPATTASAANQPQQPRRSSTESSMFGSRGYGSVPSAGLPPHGAFRHHAESTRPTQQAADRQEALGGGFPSVAGTFYPAGRVQREADGHLAGDASGRQDRARQDQKKKRKRDPPTSGTSKSASASSKKAEPEETFIFCLIPYTARVYAGIATKPSAAEYVAALLSLA